MTPTALEIIDTSIKIGLGALIAAISSYVIVKINHRADSNKAFSERAFDSIELISDSAEVYYQKFFALIGRVNGVSKGDVEVGSKFTQSAWEFIDIGDDELVDARNKRMTAIVRLRLLNLIEPAEILELTSIIEKEFRDIIIFQKVVPGDSEIKSYRDQMNSSRRRFFALLSEQYKPNGIIEK